MTNKNSDLHYWCMQNIRACLYSYMFVFVCAAILESRFAYSVCHRVMLTDADYFSLSDRTSCLLWELCRVSVNDLSICWNSEKQRWLNKHSMHTSVFGWRCPHPKWICKCVRLMCSDVSYSNNMHMWCFPDDQVLCSIDDTCLLEIS